MAAPEGIRRVGAKLDAWGHALWGLLPNLVVALVVFAAFWFAARLVRQVAHRALQRFSKNAEVNAVVAGTGRFAVICFGLFVSLGILELDKTVTSLLAGVGVLGLALGFAFKDIFANYLSGVIIAVRSPFELGELVELEGHFGTVVAVDLRTTVLKKPSGELVIIPNQEIVQNPIVNFSRSGERRVELEVGVPYGEDLERARRIAIEAVEGIAQRDDSRSVELYFSRFGESSIDFIVRFWSRDVAQGEFLAARSAAIVAIKRAFDAHDITIPWPIRTLEIGQNTRALFDRKLAARGALNGGDERAGARR